LTFEFIYPPALRETSSLIVTLIIQTLKVLRRDSEFR
jgi:hypothetical protein